MQTNVHMSIIAVEEIEPKNMRGSGALTDDDIRVIDTVTAELKSELQQFKSFLSQGSDAGLQARLAKLDETRDAVPLLRELERIVTANGLLELRTTLSMLLDALEGNRFEIGVFGRTSSGKSSLLNRLLETQALPVGATPVTAVPTRVQFGPEARATIEFAQRSREVIDLSRLAEFSTEQQNPANRKYVTRIVVELPAARLRDGVTLVDTPGVGSLATHGAAETSAYLPRCDLGVVLVDAAATLTQEDLLMVRTLLRAGANAMVLVSKADLLDAQQQQSVLDYLQTQFAAQLGVAPPLYLVSTVGADASLCDAWYEQALRPVLERHREEAAKTLKRKVGLLRDATIAALERRLGEAVATVTSPDPSREQTLAALRDADGLAALAERGIDAQLDNISRLTGTIVETAAASIVAEWKQGSDVDRVREACTQAMAGRVAHGTTTLLQLLGEVRGELDQRLTHGMQAASLASNECDSLPVLTGAPLFDAEALTRPIDLHAPTLVKVLANRLLRSCARRRLQGRARDLQASLDQYRRQLREWAHRSLTELLSSFHAHAAPVLMHLTTRATATGHIDRAALEGDVRRLREFGSTARIEHNVESLN